MSLTIQAARLWDSILELAQIGGTPDGGVSRLTLTALDREARDLFTRWVAAAGCQVAIDPIGNMFARREGREADAAPVLVGSHLDTQPSGGKFDGIYGVMAGLEIIRTLNDRGIETKRPIEVVNWTNEEGSRFAPVMMGSAVYAGARGLKETLATVDRNGISVADALNEIGYAGDADLSNRPIHACLEAHIEQGPVLEQKGVPIGIVTGGYGLRWFDIDIHGRESHAGTTPMGLRQDALVAAAEIISKLTAMAIRFEPEARITIGDLSIAPGSRNTVPGHVQLKVDARHPEAAVLDQIEQEITTLCREVQSGRGTRTEIVKVADNAPVRFSAEVIAQLREAAQAIDAPAIDLVSGAGHDAFHVARIAPAGMVFVPCAGGLSHTPLESATPEDLALGCEVLYRAVLALANT